MAIIRFMPNSKPRVFVITVAVIEVKPDEPPSNDTHAETCPGLTGGKCICSKPRKPN